MSKSKLNSVQTSGADCDSKCTYQIMIRDKFLGQFKRITIAEDFSALVLLLEPTETKP